MTQADVANQLGVDTVSVSRWETGVRAPSMAHIEVMAELYGVTPSEILGRAALYHPMLAELAITPNMKIVVMPNDGLASAGVYRGDVVIADPGAPIEVGRSYLFRRGDSYELCTAALVNDVLRMIVNQGANELQDWPAGPTIFIGQIVWLLKRWG